jgi:hypothetical protein
MTRNVAERGNVTHALGGGEEPEVNRPQACGGERLIARESEKLQWRALARLARAVGDEQRRDRVRFY